MSELRLTGARLVLSDRVTEPSSLVVRDGVIAEIAEGKAGGGLDLEGDYLLPGLVELHTDNMERHMHPRTGVSWPKEAAVLAHDGEVAAAGITTVFNALAIRDMDGLSTDLADQVAAVEAVRAAGLTKVDHYIHLRAEISVPTMQAVMGPLLEMPGVRLVSLMDHTPGQRQFADVARAREYQRKKRGLSEAEAETLFAMLAENQARWAAPNRAATAAVARRRGVALASHDDATPEHVAEAVSEGAVLAEFPTTLAAAEAARAGGLAILMGAPNVVRGQSHSGNVAATALAGAGLLDILSSDYVPSSLMLACFALAPMLGLPAAVRMVSETPARVVGLDDRGRIAPGLRGDLVRVRQIGDRALIRGVWHRGQQVG